MGRRAKYENYIDISGLVFRRNGKDILRGIDWLAPRGSHWAVIGANGSGKTTLLQIAGGSLFPTAGSVVVLGRRFGETDLMQLRRRVGWASSALQARMPRHESVLETVVSGLKATFGLVYEYAPDDAGRARDLIAGMGLAGFEDTAFGVLSQGEQQKALFARALMPDPEILILDEVCSGLDLRARESLLAGIGRVMAEQRAGVIMVTHHIEEIPPEVDHALILKDGRAYASGRIDSVLTSETLSETMDMPVSVERENGRFRAAIVPAGSGQSSATASSRP